MNFSQVGGAAGMHLSSMKHHQTRHNTQSLELRVDIFIASGAESKHPSWNLLERSAYTLDVVSLVSVWIIGRIDVAHVTSPNTLEAPVVTRVPVRHGLGALAGLFAV